MNAAVAESEQRWQNKEQELQTKVSELQAELRKEQLRVSLLHKPAATTRIQQVCCCCWIYTTESFAFEFEAFQLCDKFQEKVF